MDMFSTTKKETASVKTTYESPVLTIFKTQNTDIITDSHVDPNMGEWDTN